MNTSYVLHREKYSSSKIAQVLHGYFTSRQRQLDIHQLCLGRRDHLDIYDIVKMQSHGNGNSNTSQDSDGFRLSYRLDYMIYGEINAMEKMRGFKGGYDAIVLAVDSKRIVIVEYDQRYDAFGITALYGIDHTLLNGKLFDISPLQVISSIMFNCLVFVYNDNLITFLHRKDANETNHMVIDDNSDASMKYYDTLHGDKYFDPSVHYNHISNFVYKIRKVFLKQKNEEEFDYDNKLKPNESNGIVQYYLLYEDSSLSEQSNLIPYVKTKVNVAFVEISLQSGALNSFEILWENVDMNTFDFFVLENSLHSKEIVLFSAYQIQIISLNQTERKSNNYILNQIYPGIFYKEYYCNNPLLYNVDGRLIEKNIDLRGGGYLILNNSAFLFTTSQGEMYFFTLKTPNQDAQIDILTIQHTATTVNDLSVDNNLNQPQGLGAPYNIICMPYPSLFFLSSLFSDGLLISYSTLSSCSIVDNIINLSPIINFTLLNENKSVKYALTTGYDKTGKMNFIYDKFKFYEVLKNFGEFYDISFMKSIRFDDALFTRYLICGLKSENSVIFEINGTSIENITERIVYNKESNIITAELMQIENLKTMTLIVIVNVTMIQIFNPFLQLLITLRAKDLFSNGKKEGGNIVKCRIGSDSLIVSNENKEMVIVHFYVKPSNNNESNKGLLYTEHKINKTISYCYRDVTEVIRSQSILKYDLNSKEYQSGPMIYNSYLIIYRTDQSLEIYDLKSLFTATPICLLCNTIISELPEIVSCKQYQEDDYLRSQSDLTMKLSLNISPNETNIALMETPEEIFFDTLDTKCLLCMLFKNRTIVIYELFYEYSASNQPPLIRMKKIYIDYLQKLDYKEFFMIESSNIFIKFKKIANCPGILINISNYQRFIFEVNGRIIISQVDNNDDIKRNFSAFAELSNEEIENGFIIYENGAMKHCFTPKGYQLTDYGLHKSNLINRFPVNLNYIAVPSTRSVLFCYLLIEKSLSGIKVNQDKTIQSNNHFNYFLTFRTEDQKPVDQITFASNEIIVESRVVELPSIGLINTKKYFAVGVNVIDPKGEETQSKARLHLYDIEKGKFVKIYDQELFKGTISMIHSIEKILIVGEGSRIFLYQYLPGINEMKKIGMLDNKHLSCCSKIQSKFLIVGDIIESVSWMVYTQANNPTLLILGKDNSKYHSTAIDFWIDQDKSGCILCDDNRNGHVFLITKEEKAMQLNEVADFHLGKVITELRWFLIQNKNVYYYSGDDGSIGYFIPIKEEIYEKISLLCEFLYNHLPYHSGLNPKGFFEVKNFPFKKPKGKFIDMRILLYYYHLPIAIQSFIAQRVVSERETIITYMNDLLI